MERYRKPRRAQHHRVEYVQGGHVLQRLKDAALLQTFSKAGLEPRGGTPEELSKYQATEIAKWAEVVKAIGYEAK